MSLKENKKTMSDELPNGQPPEFPPEEFVEPMPQSPILMRIMLIVINLAALIFYRSFLQSWYSIHGTSPVWIPCIFLIVPLGSLFFIYFYMGRIGYERVIKLICFAFLAIQVANFFTPIDSSQITLGSDGYSSDYSYVTQTGNLLGLSFPADGTATTVDSKLYFENKEVGFITSVKSLIQREKLYSCTDVVYTDEQVEDFEASLLKDPMWLKELPEKVKKLSFTSAALSDYDYFLFFDCENNKFNILPDSGKHTIYCVMYNSQKNSLQILKYSKNF